MTAAVTLWSRGAAADAVFPTVTRIAFSPGDPNAIVAGATVRYARLARRRQDVAAALQSRAGASGTFQ